MPSVKSYQLYVGLFLCQVPLNFVSFLICGSILLRKYIQNLLEREIVYFSMSLLTQSASQCPHCSTGHYDFVYLSSYLDSHKNYDMMLVWWGLTYDWGGVCVCQGTGWNGRQQGQWWEWRKTRDCESQTTNMPLDISTLCALVVSTPTDWQESAQVSFVRVFHLSETSYACPRLTLYSPNFFVRGLVL